MTNEEIMELIDRNRMDPEPDVMRDMIWASSGKFPAVKRASEIRDKLSDLDAMTMIAFHALSDAAKADDANSTIRAGTKWVNSDTGETMVRVEDGWEIGEKLLRLTQEYVQGLDHNPECQAGEWLSDAQIAEREIESFIKWLNEKGRDK